ncbi:MAG: alcohol dehydrogenase catalytic domain-containing protein, partial [Methanomassiliicoccales archaeon]|nr:alcohol dehydrogenase catalytic domain-containing protein [Methanomassiliicoccales archaeon]
MKAMALATDRPGEWLELTDMPAEEPGDGEVLIRVDVCGVCRTDLHIVEGDIGNVRHGLVPGHEAVGKIVRTGEGVTSLSTGDVVGVPWLH